MKPRLFISCVTPEFRSLRARVAQVLQFLGYEPEFQETFGTEAGDLRQVLRDKIATCEGLVQIIGEGYGAEAPAPDADFGRVSYTQFEFLHAREQKKKTWLLFAGPGATRDTEIAGLDHPPAGLALQDGVTQEAWQAERRALQAAYRQRFEGDAHLRHPINSAAELENAVLKIRNDSEELRRQFQDWQRGLSEGQTRIESGQRRQSRVLRLLGVGVLSLLALGGALAWWLAQRAPDQIAGRVAAQVVKVQYDADEVRRKLVLEVETVYQSKLLATKAAPDWQERERLRKAAEEERAQILKDVDSLLADIAEAYRRGEASEIYQEILRILEEQGVQEALRYLGSKTATIDANVARLIASRESLTQRIRTELRPKLLGAGLAATAGEEARAEALYRDVLAADPAWPEARFRFVEFLLYTKGPRRETHASLAEAGAVYREAEEIARRLAAESTSAQAEAADFAKHKRELSVALNKLGDLAVAQGDLAGALRSFSESRAIAERLADSDPANAGWQFDLGISIERLGNLAVAQGKLDEALVFHTKHREIIERLAASDPAKAAWQRDLSVSLIKLGDLAVAQGDLAAALHYFSESKAIAERLVASAPANPARQRDLAQSHCWVGMVQQQGGDLAKAKVSFTAYKDIMESLAASDPANAGWQRDLSVSLNKLGNLAVKQGDLAAALRSFSESKAIFERLAASDPTNAAWQRDLSVSLNQMGELAVVQGDLGAALRYYTESKAITERLADSDPDNAEWQRDIFISFERLGDIVQAKGDLAAAVGHFEKSRQGWTKLIQQDAANISLQSGITVPLNRLGELAVAQGDLAGALRYYTEAKAIAERLAASDPANTEWQFDMATLLGRIGMLHESQGNLDEAECHYREYQSKMERLAASDPANAAWQRDLSISLIKLGELAVAQGDLAGALRYYIEAKAIAQLLATSDPANAEWQRHLSYSCYLIASKVFMPQERWAEALKLMEHSLGISERLAAKDRSNVSWQEDEREVRELVTQLRTKVGGK